jgi:SAM-dependent methyltransferase
MDILEMNKRAWDNIGSKAGPVEIKTKKYREMFDLFCSKMPINARILDLGCGTGLPVVNELVDKGFQVIGVDFSDTMIELARKNVPNAEYVKIEMTEIEYDNEFDGIVSRYSMLCLDMQNFKKTALKISKALKKKGLFLLSLNEPPPEGHDEKENYTVIMGQEIYSRPYTENEIRDIFEKCDMQIIRVEREQNISEEYGKEYELIVLMQKE